MSTETAVKERPILFSGPMVRAILGGNKTQTRRIIKPQPPSYINELHGGKLSKRFPYSLEDDDMNHVGEGFQDDNGQFWICPYGKAGDRLWVRENFQQVEQDGFTVKPRTELQRTRQGLCYQADGESCPITFGDVPLKWRPSIHMPRWACRITLEITELRIERLQGISEADALAEGVTDDPPCTAADMYSVLWEQINGEGSWGLNPWVWAVSFTRLNG